MLGSVEIRIGVRKDSCHSEKIRVIPSEARNIGVSRYRCRFRFFTPLRSVQNDTTASALRSV